MAQRFYVGGTGNWNTTASWSTTSGGASGASVPTSVDDAIFDVNSGAFACTINTTASCNNLDTSAVNNPSARIILFGGAGNSLSISGSCTLGALGGGSNLFSGGAGDGIVNFVGTGSVTSAGNFFVVSISGSAAAVNFSGTYTLNDAFTCGLGGQQILEITGGSLTTNNKNLSCSSLSVTNSPTVDFGTSIISLTQYKGTILSFSTGSTITATNADFQLFGANNGQGGQVFPSIIDLNGKSIGFLALAYSVNFDDTYTNSQYWRFKTGGTIGQLDVPNGVFMKAVAGITLTITNCNIVGSNSLPCSFISETGGSVFNLCITNNNIMWTTFKDVNFNCGSANDPHGSCTSNCTNITFNTPATTQRGAAILALL